MALALAELRVFERAMDVTIIDCGLGNIKSIRRMVQAVDGEAEIVTDPAAIQECRRLIIPGVGAFDTGMRLLSEAGWIDPLREAALERRVPTLGICLGMQLLCRRSDEGELPGLGWIAADVRQLELPQGTGLKVPHMGWSVTTPIKANPLIPREESEQRFYHVHKYHAVCDHPQDVLATATYGIEFTAAFSRDNLYGVQFHPEKSHRFGMALLRRFLDIPC